MSIVTKFVGLDVHKSSVSIAVAEGGVGQDVHHLGSIAHDVPRIVKRLLSLGPAESLRVAYEAASACGAHFAPRGFTAKSSLRRRHPCVPATV